MQAGTTATHNHTRARALFLRTCSTLSYPTAWPRDFSFYLPAGPLCFTAFRSWATNGPLLSVWVAGKRAQWQYAVELGRVWEKDAVTRCDML